MDESGSDGQMAAHLFPCVGPYRQTPSLPLCSNKTEAVANSLVSISRKSGPFCWNRPAPSFRLIPNVNCVLSSFLLLRSCIPPPPTTNNKTQQPNTLDHVHTIRAVTWTWCQREVEILSVSQPEKQGGHKEGGRPTFHRPHFPLFPEKIQAKIQAKYSPRGVSGTRYRQLWLSVTQQAIELDNRL